MKKKLAAVISSAMFAMAIGTNQGLAQITWDANTGTTGAQDGAGAWNTSNTNWWDGTTNVSFTTGSNVIIGAGSGAAGAITVDAGGVTTGSLTFNASGSGSYTLSGGSITGGALVKNGANGLRFDNANTFSSITASGGPNSASDGAFRLGNAGALGTADIAFTNTASMTGFFFLTGFGSNTTMSNNIAFSTTGGITTNILSTGVAGTPTALPGSFNTTTLSGLLTGGSATTIVNNNNSVTAGVARLRLTNASNSVTLQHWNLNRGGLEFTSDGALGNANNDLRLDVTSTNVGTGLLFGANNIALNANRTVTVQSQTIIDTQAFTGSVINGGVTLTGNVVKRGTSDLRLNGAVTGTGGVSVFQGTVVAGNASLVGSGTITLGQAANLTANTVGFSTAPLTSNVSIANNIALAGTGQRNLVMSGVGNGTNTAEYSGLISGSATTLFLDNTTSGTTNPQFILSNSLNSFTATVQVNRGGLRIASNEALGNITNAVIFDSNSGADLTFLNSMNYTRNTTMTFGTAFDFDTGTNAVTASGTISGTSGITKIGSGTLTLTGANTYGGGTTVSAGTLIVNNTSGSGTGTGAATVASSATLGGTGSLTGAVTVNGTIAPGASVESLATGAMTINGTFAYEGDSGAAELADLLKVNGALTLNNATLTTTGLDSIWSLGAKFTLISYVDGGSGITSGFTSFNDDSDYAFGGANLWTLNYNDTAAGTNFNAEAISGGATHFVTITAVPEPSALLLSAVMVAGLGFRRRRAN